MERRYMMLQTNGEFWFHPVLEIDDTVESTWEACQPTREWVKANIPPCYVTFTGRSILILHPAYATAFRMRWC